MFKTFSFKEKTRALALPLSVMDADSAVIAEEQRNSKQYKSSGPGKLASGRSVVQMDECKRKIDCEYECRIGHRSLQI